MEEPKEFRPRARGARKDRAPYSPFVKQVLSATAKAGAPLKRGIPGVEPFEPIAVVRALDAVVDTSPRNWRARVWDPAAGV
jgi:hypothetical protein